MGRLRIPAPTTTTGWTLVFLGVAVVVVSWVLEWMSARHLPGGHGPFYALLAAVVVLGGCGLITSRPA